MKIMNIFPVSYVSSAQHKRSKITSSQVEHILSFMHNSPDSHHLILLTSHQSKRDVRETDMMNRKINIIKQRQRATSQQEWQGKVLN
jgi:hypothetical protein